MRIQKLVRRDHITSVQSRSLFFDNKDCSNQNYRHLDYNGLLLFCVFISY